MSTIKSSAENLTLNADGANNDIKFQSNGTEVASIDQAGVLTAGGATLTGNITHAGDLTLDAGATINLDADGAYIYLKDAGTSVGLFKLTSSDFYIKSVVDDKDLIFQGKDGSSTVTALTLDMSDAGVAKFNRGILFNNDTAAANELDDYEEGTWTPSFTGSDTAGTYTYSQQHGRYIKIGNHITIWFSLFNITDTSAGGGNIRITGIPFNVSSGPHRGCVGTLELDNFTFSGSLSTTVESSMTYITPRQSISGSADSILQVSNRSSDTSDFCGSITYFAD